MTLLDVVIKNEEGKVYENEVFKYRIKDGVLEFDLKRRKCSPWKICHIEFDDLKNYEVEEVKDNPFERVEKGKRYYFVTMSFDGVIVDLDEEEYHELDKRRFEASNYFKDKEIAVECAECLNEAMKEFKQNKLKELGIEE